MIVSIIKGKAKDWKEQFKKVFPDPARPVIVTKGMV